MAARTAKPTTLPPALRPTLPTRCRCQCSAPPLEGPPLCRCWRRLASPCTTPEPRTLHLQAVQAFNKIYSQECVHMWTHGTLRNTLLVQELNTINIAQQHESTHATDARTAQITVVSVNSSAWWRVVQPDVRRIEPWVHGKARACGRHAQNRGSWGSLTLTTIGRVGALRACAHHGSAQELGILDDQEPGIRDGLF